MNIDTKKQRKPQSKSEWAILYGKNGYKIFPVHSIKDSKCTCNSPKCTSPGKHPYHDKELLPNGHKSASNDVEIIKQWWTKWPDANIGLLTGCQNDIVVLDIDPKNGGNDSLREIVEIYGELPKTFKVRSGSDGEHYYFRYPKNIKIKSSINYKGFKGVDLKSDGGYIIAPPSSHISGNIYKFENEFELSSLPEWMAASSCKSSREYKDFNILGALEGVSEGQRDETLFRFICELKASGVSKIEATQYAISFCNKCNPPFPTEAAIEKVNRIYSDSKSSNKTHFEGAFFPEMEFPINIFPKPIIEIAKAISKMHSVEFEFVVIAMLNIISGCIGNSLRVKLMEGHTHKVFLWTIFVAESGYGKSPVFNRLLEPLRNYEKQEKKPCIADDFTLEALSEILSKNDRGVITYQDEISGFFLSLNQYKSKGNDQERILQLWNGNPLIIDRKGQKFEVYNPGLALFGGIQPKILPRILSEDKFDNGLLTRFLMFYSKPVKKVFSAQPIDSNLLKEWEKLVGYCLEYGDQEIQAIYDAQALAIYGEFYNQLHNQTNLDSTLKLFLSKVDMYCIKLSGLVHLLECYSLDRSLGSSVSADIVEKAISLTRYFQGHLSKSVLSYKHATLSLDSRQVAIIKALYKIYQSRPKKVSLMDLLKTVNTYLESGYTIQSNQSKVISTYLKNWGITCRTGTSGYKYLDWEPEKLKQLFNKFFIILLTFTTHSDSDSCESDESEEFL